MDWTKKKVLITGAGGFIGSHLTELLVTLGAQTRALVHYNSAGTRGWLEYSAVQNYIEFFAGDVRDPDSIQRAITGTDIVFHLAALVGIPYSYHAPLSYIRTNVEGTLNVAQSAMNAGVELFVHTSTSEVYGTPMHIPINEDHPVRGQSPYSASKIGGDKIVEAFHLSFSLPVVTLRPFNTYGPRQSARAIIPTIITQALKGDAIRLGNLKPTRDFNFVADTVESFVTAAENPAAIGSVVNIGSGKEIAMEDLARMIIKMIGRDMPVVCDEERLRPDNSEIDRLCADNGKAAALLDWHPDHTLEQGLAKTIDWIRENQNQYRPDVYQL